MSVIPNNPLDLTALWTQYQQDNQKYIWKYKGNAKRSKHCQDCRP